jgi:iron complex outermembrane receptor protein
VAAFHYNYKDLQVQSFTLLPPPAPPILASQLTNAASSEIYGFEISGSIDVSQYLTVNAGLAWTHARYKNFTTAQGFGLCPLTSKTVSGVTTYYDATGYVVFSSPTNICNDTTVAGSPALPAGFNTRTAGTIDRSGDPMIRAPEWNANLAVDWRIPTSYGQFGFNGSAFYSSWYGLADLSPTGIGDKSYRYIQPAYVMLNAQLSLAPKFNENLKFTLWGRNLADETIYLSASGSGGDKYTFASGRTYGVQIEFNF